MPTAPQRQGNIRNPGIDILRGIAIFTMVAANFSASLLQAADKTLPFRLYGTFAAPLFIVLAGMMVVITQGRHPSFGHYLRRGLLIIGCGCLLDIAVWHTYPLLSYDVLYLTGLAIPIIYLLNRYCGIYSRAFIAALLVLASPLLQTLFGYRLELPGLELEDTGFADYLAQLFSGGTVQRLLLDGWFPIMPWLGFAVLGSVLGDGYRRNHTLASAPVLFSGASLLTAGVSLWLYQQPNLVIRDGYSELFYPPTIAYFCTATGLILLGFYVVEKTKNSPIHWAFLKLGHASLFMYIFHQVLLVFVLKPIAILNGQPMAIFLPVYLSSIAIMIGIGHILLGFKQKQKNLPFLLKFLLGS